MPPDTPPRPAVLEADPAVALHALLGLDDEPAEPRTLKAIRVWLLLAAVANYASCALPLISSAAHQLFGVGNWASSWTHDPEPTRGWLFWVFLGYGCLWGTLFLFIRADPIGRRPLLRVGIAEKVLTTIAVWTAYVVDDIELALPLIILVTDLLFVVVFVWAGRAADRLTAVPADDEDARRPYGSSPPARWLLRLVALPTMAGGLLLAGAAIAARVGASMECLQNVPATATDQAKVPPASCTLLGSSDLWGLPPFLVWIWGAMVVVVAVLLMWVSADVVRRRDVIGFGIAAQLIPAAAVVAARFSDNVQQRPPTTFLVVVVVSGSLAAGAVWLAKRCADASALVLGVDLPARELRWWARAVVEFHSTIVIGSGFGGSFAARALADEGEPVLVLERGRRWSPGEFPRRPDELFANVWDPPRGRYGLFDIRRFKGLHAVTAAGVGGGSLIYANVQLRKPSGWFTTAIDGQRSIDWPVSREELDRHYDHVAKLLDAGPFEAPVSVVPRAAAFEWAARRKGYTVFKPDLAVRFEPPEGDPDRPGRQSCTMCGECIIGCNVGAKNTLDLTVLDHDLIDVRPYALVRSIARRGPYFVVRYIDVEHLDGTAIAERREAVRELSCLVLVVAAGALGSTELLLRSTPALPGLSAALGSRYSPNGDLLTFGSRIGRAREAAQFADQAADMGTGPTITRCIKVDGPGPDGQRFFRSATAAPIVPPPGLSRMVRQAPGSGHR